MCHFEPYRRAFTDDERISVEFDSLDQLFSIEPLPTHSHSPNFSHFALMDLTVVAVYRDKKWIAGWVSDSIELPLV